MVIPKLEELDCAARIQERRIKKYYPEFHQFILDTYPNYPWAEKLALYYNGLKTPPKCVVCGAPVSFYSLHRGWARTCGMVCAGKNPEVMLKKYNTSMEHYGVPYPAQGQEVKDKMKQTNLERYGVENPFASDEIKERIKEHNIRTYGGNSPMCSPEVRRKSVVTCIQKYGTEHNTQAQEIKDKVRKTCEEQYGGIGWASTEIMDKFKQTIRDKYDVEYITQNNDIRQKIIDTKIDKLKNKYDDILDIYFDQDANDYIYVCKCPHPGCTNCELKTYKITANGYRNRRSHKIEPCTNIQPLNDTSSSLEKIVRGWLDSLDLEYQTNVRDIIPPKELDIYIPSKKIAIEINGCYWHSDQEKPKNYHMDKYKDCEAHGIQLIQIWEDWLINKPDIIQSILLSKLGECHNVIYARQCELREVNPKDTRIFLEENHIQGPCNSKYSYGLYYDNELVSLMTFGAQRKNLKGNLNEGEYELLRFCNKLDIRVVGGASRLLKHFIKLVKPLNIVSFASCDISNGNLYNALGFETDGNISQSYWYIDPEDFQRYHRSSFTKASIVKRGWKASVDSSWTERDVMDAVGFIRIYDAGQTKWTKKL